MLFPSVSVPGELTRIALSDVHAGDDLPNVNARMIRPRTPTPLNRLRVRYRCSPSMR